MKIFNHMIFGLVFAGMLFGNVSALTDEQIQGIIMSIASVNAQFSEEQVADLQSQHEALAGELSDLLGDSLTISEEKRQEVIDLFEREIHCLTGIDDMSDIEEKDGFDEAKQVPVKKEKTGVLSGFGGYAIFEMDEGDKEVDGKQEAEEAPLQSSSSSSGCENTEAINGETEVTVSVNEHLNELLFFDASGNSANRAVSDFVDWIRQQGVNGLLSRFIGSSIRFLALKLLFEYQTVHGLGLCTMMYLSSSWVLGVLENHVAEAARPFVEQGVTKVTKSLKRKFSDPNGDDANPHKRSRDEKDEEREKDEEGEKDQE